MTFIRRLTHDERGATAIEYALIITLIAAVVVGGMSALGSKMGGVYNQAAAGFPAS